jgi:hypothetical protein
MSSHLLSSGSRRFGRGASKIAKGAGLGHWTTHELRHTCASLLIEAKVPLDQVSDHLGHASIQVTNDVYVHRLKGSGEKAALAMEKLLYGDDRSNRITQEKALASPLARPRPANDAFTPMTRDLVGRPGLDPGTLRVFPERPGTSINVQICWLDKVECPPRSTDVLSRLTSWLDSWLDLGSFQGQATIQFRGSEGEVFELRLGEE